MAVHQNRSALKISIVSLLAFLVVMGSALLAISKNPSTPFDESAHWDYLEKISSGDIPPVNDRYGQVVLKAVACTTGGAGDAWSGLEKCGSDYFTPEKAPFAGLSSATGYAPTYYALTAIPYSICQSITNETKLSCGRISNSLWLGTAAIMIVLLSAYLGGGLFASFAYAVGVLTFPSVILQGITINSDAAAFALLPAYFLALAILARSNISNKSVLPWAVVTVLGILVVTTKETLLPGVLIGYVFYIANLPANDKSANARSYWIWIPAALSSAALLLGAFVSRSLQSVFRGLAGIADMDLALAIPLRDLPFSIMLSITESMSPYDLVVWAPFTKQEFQLLTILGGMLTWVALALAFVPSVKSSAMNFQMIFLAWTLPAVLVLATWIGSQNAPVQPRYYMATSITLGIIGLATVKNRFFVNFAKVVYLASFSAFLYTVASI